MTQLAVERLFQRCAISSFHWAFWDDEYVVFDEASGQTHLLDPIKAYILDVLSDGSADLSRLTVLLEQALSVRAHTNPHDVVLAALEHLERAQLIESVPL